MAIKSRKKSPMSATLKSKITNAPSACCCESIMEWTAEGLGENWWEDGDVFTDSDELDERGDCALEINEFCNTFFDDPFSGKQGETEFEAYGGIPATLTTFWDDDFEPSFRYVITVSVPFDVGGKTPVDIRLKITGSSEHVNEKVEPGNSRFYTTSTRSDLNVNDEMVVEISVWVDP